MIDTEYVKNISNIFIKSEVFDVSKANYNFNEVIQSKFIEKLFYSVNLDENRILNTMYFISEGKNVLTLKAQNDAIIYKKGKETLLLYNILISILMVILFYFINKRQITLKTLVEKRTSSLNNALRSLEEKNQELYELSTTDSLTKIKNRRSFFHGSKLLLQQAIDEKKDFFVILIDLDHFKNINDTYGHATGDTVLKQFCNIVSNQLKKDEIFGRLGGEEFCVSIYNQNLPYIESLAENIRQKCASTSLDIDNKKVQFTVSIGIAKNDKNNMYIDQILQCADRFLYKAKEDGRNRVIRHTE